MLTTHGALQAQTTDLVAAWQWTADDHILHFLPLHHVHGVVNKLACPLWCGALVEFIKWDAHAVWRRLMELHGLTVFMAVPTVSGMLEQGRGLRHCPSYTQPYGRCMPSSSMLLMRRHLRTRRPCRRVFKGCDSWYGLCVLAAACACVGVSKTSTASRPPCHDLLLQVSGSAALPVPVLQRWRDISTHTLLERYGMTEFGMALSNSLAPSDRVPGCVGLPLPSVEVRVVDDDGTVITPPSDRPGELRVRGATLFTEYVGRPEATAEAFDDDVSVALVRPPRCS